jgi:hypothetical protein
MSETWLLGLAKIFEQRDYAEAFARGLLYMNAVDYFREHRDSSNVLRGDPYEGLAGIFQPSKIGTLKFGDVEIALDSLAGPVLIHDQAALAWNVFCMYSLNSRGWTSTVSADTLKDLKATLLMDMKCHGLGSDVVVVTNASAFQDRVEAAARKTGFYALWNLVDYYDHNTQHGSFERDKAPFMKRAEYAYQREWRIVLKRLPASTDPYTLDIGDIRDITKLTTAEEFNKLLELRLPDGSTA